MLSIVKEFLNSPISSTVLILEYQLTKLIEAPKYLKKSIQNLLSGTKVIYLKGHIDFFKYLGASINLVS